MGEYDKYFNKDLHKDLNKNDITTCSYDEPYWV